MSLKEWRDHTAAGKREPFPPDMLRSAGVELDDVPHTYAEDLPMVAKAAKWMLKDPMLRWAHPVMWKPWIDLMRTCTESMLADFLAQVGPTPMVCLSVLTWVKPLKGSVSLQRGRVCLQYDDHQALAPDKDRYMCSCKWCHCCDTVDINPWDQMGCPHCDSEYLPVRSPRSRCICHNRYYYDVNYVLEDIHSGDLRIPELLRYMQTHTPPPAATPPYPPTMSTQEQAAQRARERIKNGTRPVSKAKLRLRSKGK